VSQGYIPVTLRRAVYDRAGGRCEYCLIPEAFTLFFHEVDHIIAQKHGGATDADNLALACVFCNQHKGTDIASIDPHSGRLEALFHPRKHSWNGHFDLIGAQVRGCTAIGRVTVKLLQLNDPVRVIERGILLEAGLFER
jgi:hypothetical protein